MEELEVMNVEDVQIVDIPNMLIFIIKDGGKYRRIKKMSYQHDAVEIELE